MKSSSFLTLILITLFFSIGFKQVVVANSVVFGYLPEWRYHALSFESVSEHVTHIIFFSLEMDPKTGMITAMDVCQMWKRCKGLKEPKIRRNCIFVLVEMDDQMVLNSS